MTTIVDLPEVSRRLKDLRARLGLHQYEVAAELAMSPRTFQSWENGEVLTSGPNYNRLAEYYSEKLGEAISRNTILFGHDSGIRLGEDPSLLTDEIREQIDRLHDEFSLKFEELALRLREEIGLNATAAERADHKKDPRSVRHAKVI